eukprot:1139786-Pelagomonas_calceolata.AAC.5
MALARQHLQQQHAAATAESSAPAAAAAGSSASNSGGSPAASEVQVAAQGKEAASSSYIAEQAAQGCGCVFHINYMWDAAVLLSGGPYTRKEEGQILGTATLAQAHAVSNCEGS